METMTERACLLVEHQGRHVPAVEPVTGYTVRRHSWGVLSPPPADDVAALLSEAQRLAYRRDSSYTADSLRPALAAEVERLVREFNDRWPLTPTEAAS